MRIAVALLLAALAAPALAEKGEAVEPLSDNSFLIEEAYNQEPGVVQNIFLFTRDKASGSWLATFTQEWPLGGQAHQGSYTLGLGEQAAALDSGVGFADVMLNYRYQAADGEVLAVSPRASAIIPSAATRKALGQGGIGVQLALPVSLHLGRWFDAHTNLGGTWTPKGRRVEDGASTEYRSFFAGEGLVWLLHPRFNLLVEGLWTSGWSLPSGFPTERADTFVVSPGFRAAHDFGEVQVTVGMAVPLGVGPSKGDRAVLGYLSVEFPFMKVAPEPEPEKAAGPARP